MSSKPVRAGRLGGYLAPAVAGVPAAYFCDLDRGRSRRRRIRARVAGTARHGVRRTGRELRKTAALAQGREHFRDRSVLEGQLNVNEDGTVLLRGQVDSSELVRELERHVRRIAGVGGVENLLHLPGTPAPASYGRTKAPPPGM
jgi:osmotically-inducible protein OsmY